MKDLQKNGLLDSDRNIIPKFELAKSKYVNGKKKKEIRFMDKMSKKYSNHN